MTTMLQRIRERVKLSNEQNAISAGSFYGDDECVEAKAFMKGRKLENEFLQQHIDALIQAVEKGDEALKCYEPTTVTRAKVDGEIYDNLHLGKLAQEARASMQSILEKAVK